MKIGSVPYLNALPLIYGLDDEIIKLPPVTLAKLLRSEKLDVALAPSAALFDEPCASVIPGICIGSDGHVNSVRLYHIGDIRNLRKVALDMESKTSVLLAQVILAKKYGIEPLYISSPRISLADNEEGFDAQLLIGDKAMNHNENIPFMDLGFEWKSLTGLPFVYAFWTVRKNFMDVRIPGLFRKSKSEGIENIEKIISRLPSYNPQMLREYFSANVKYDLESEFIEGFRLFNRMCVDIGLAKTEVEVRIYGETSLAQSS